MEEGVTKKIAQAKSLIIKALLHAKKPAVGFSGGKDSTVVLSLVRSIDPSVPAVFCNTGVEDVRTIEYVHRVPNLVELHPKKGVTFWTIAKTEGLPVQKGKGKTRENKCCHDLKDRPMKRYVKQEGIDLIFTGLTKAESWQRYMRLTADGPYCRVKSWYNIWKCHPISDWSEEEVWEYIDGEGIDHNAVYRETGVDRVGCLPCTAYKIWKKNLRKQNPKMLRILLRMQKQSQLEDWEPCGGFSDD